MAELIRMPKMSDTMQQGMISRWLKQVGEQVASGDILAEIETDKATMELESYQDGVLLYIGVAEKSTAQINDIIAIIGEPGEDIGNLLKEQPALNKDAPLLGATDSVIPDAPPVTLPTEKATQTLEAAYSMQEAAHLDRFFASPLAKKIAKEKGYDLSKIQGSGVAGRVIKKDVARFVPDVCTGTAVLGDALRHKEAYEDVPLSSIRQTMAKVLTESKVAVPHFYLTIRVNMNKVVALRSELNLYATTKISINDLVIKATALALKKHPKINAAWLGHKIRLYHHVHIGVAIAIEEGLIVPVVCFADQKPLLDISKEVKVLNEKAQQKKLAIKDYTGATFTISNLGKFGIESFSAIINPPSACILAVGAVQQVPIVQNDQLAPAHMMKVTLSCDHRVVDGAVAALFLSTLKTLMEEPLSLLV